MAAKMKWVWVAVGVGLVGAAVWQFLREAARAASRAGRPRQPWELV